VRAGGAENRYGKTLNSPWSCGDEKSVVFAVTLRKRENKVCPATATDESGWYREAF
jgi:hypothetical protein